MVVEVGTQVYVDVTEQPVAMHEFIQEVEYYVSLWAGDRLDFDPLCELIYGWTRRCLARLRPWCEVRSTASHHLWPPVSIGLSDGRVGHPPPPAN
jgi:hypothetical protein